MTYEDVEKLIADAKKEPGHLPNTLVMNPKDLEELRECKKVKTRLNGVITIRMGQGPMKIIWDKSCPYGIPYLIDI